MDQSKDFRFGLKSKSLQSKLKAIFDVIKGWWVGGCGGGIRICMR
jgi:hypothetical protein